MMRQYQKRLVTNKGGLLFKHYLKSKLKETFLYVFSGISPGKKESESFYSERKIQLLESVWTIVLLEL